MPVAILVYAFGDFTQIDAKMPMRDSHRMFLQSVMTKGIMMGREVRPLYKLCCQKFNEEPREDGLVEFVNVINNAIKQVHLEIRKGITEDTGLHCYCLVNTKESDFMKMASDYKENELEFFKKMVESVVESETGTVSCIESLNLVSQVERLNKEQAQELLNKLETDGWLCQNTTGAYTLSPRSILELEQFLFEQFPDSTVKCNMCKRICIQGQSCPSCPVKIHIHCAYTYFKNKPNIKCPGTECESDWPHELIAPKPKQVEGGGDNQNSAASRETPKKTGSGRETRRAGSERETRKRRVAHDT